MNQRLQSLERRVPLNTFGIVLAIVSMLFAIYVEYFKARGPHYRIAQQGAFDVLSVKEDVPDLQMSYAGVDLRTKGLKLQIVTFEVANEGPGELALSAYDATDLPGVIVEGAQVIKVDAVGATSEYLRTKFTPSLAGNGVVQFPPVMMDSGDSVTLKALLLADARIAPTIRTIGKVLGTRDLQLVRLDDEGRTLGFWRSMWSGPILVHLSRALAYALILVMVVVMIVVPSAALSNYLELRKRRRAIADFKSLTDVALAQQHDLVFHNYEREGEQYLRWLHHALSSPAMFKLTAEDARKASDRAGEHRHPTMFHWGLSATHVDELLASESVRLEDSTYVIDRSLRSVLDAFIRFLVGRNLYTERIRSASGDGVEFLGE